MTPYQHQQLLDAYIMQPVKDITVLARTFRCTEREASSIIEGAKECGKYTERLIVLSQQKKKPTKKRGRRC